MTLTELKKLSKHIFRLLKVNEITFPIGRTNKGNLGITFNENREDFEIMLDSVPLSTKNALVDENNIELKKMIEKYLFDQEQITYFPKVEQIEVKEMLNEETAVAPKKRGRPKKNGNKAD